MNNFKKCNIEDFYRMLIVKSRRLPPTFFTLLPGLQSFVLTAKSSNEILARDVTNGLLERVHKSFKKIMVSLSGFNVMPIFGGKLAVFLKTQCYDHFCPPKQQKFDSQTTFFPPNFLAKVFSES
jgi:hypothetical protein